MKRLGHVAAALLVAAAAALVPATPAGAEGSVPNDDRSAATPVTSLPYEESIDMTDATDEADEPEPSCAYASGSAWWAVTLAADTEVGITTAGSDYDTVLAVYDEDLAEVACDDEGGPRSTSALFFSAQADRTYYVQATGYWGDWGNLHIAFTEVRPLGNDAFADRFDLGSTGTPFVRASTTGATKEAGEPLPCDRFLIERTVWFDWTAPATGPLYWESYGRVIGFYTGATLETLESVGCGQAGYGRTEVVAGQTYRIQVGVNDLKAPGAFTFSGFLRIPAPAPANDNVANAEEIAGLNQFHEGTTDGATREEYEYSCAGSDNTIWYRYTAAESGPLVVSTEGSWVDTTVAVLRESDGYLLACNDEAPVSSTSRAGFAAVAGTTYLIQVGDYFGEGGPTRVGILRGVAHGDWGTGPGAVVTTDDDGLHEAGAKVSAPFVYGGASVAEDEDGDRYVVACAGAVLIGTCTGTYIP
jgi:hypothetical protein